LLGSSSGESFTVFVRKGGNSLLLSGGSFRSGLGLLSVGFGLLGSRLCLFDRLGLGLGSLGLDLLDSGRVDLDLLGHYFIVVDVRGWR
jgi:hypothetical protein